MKGTAVFLVAVSMCTLVLGASVTISVVYPSTNIPAGGHFALRGSACGLSWEKDTPMTSSKADTWTATVTCPSNTDLQFKSRLNNTWQIGYNEMVTVGTESSYAVVSYPFFFSTAGAYVSYQGIVSPQLNNTRGVDVYTPPSYFENYLKPINNVLIMQDGQNLFNASTSAFGVAWECQYTVNELVVAGAMEEIIIIGAWNTGANRINEYTYSYDNATSIQAGGEGDLYLDFLTESLYPEMAALYRIPSSPTPDQLGILGSSLGGLISCYAGWTRPETFGKAGCMSSSFWWNNEDFNSKIMEEFPVPSGVEFYLDSGNAGPDNDDEAQTLTILGHMEADGFHLNETVWYYMQNGGEHSEYYWGERFWVPMSDLYRPLPLPNLGGGSE